MKKILNKVQAKQSLRYFVEHFGFDLIEYGILKHPLFNYPFTTDSQTGEDVQITEENLEKYVNQRMMLIEKHIDNDNPEMAIFLFNKPYQIPAFIYIQTHLSQKAYDKLLMNIWVDTEFPHENTVEVMVALFQKGKQLMGAWQQKKYDTFPETVTIYRGLQEDAIEKGMSWTLNPKVAKWFANRFDNNGKILQAEIDKHYIFAYNNSRKEEEVIINPNYLKKIKYYIP